MVWTIHKIDKLVFAQSPGLDEIVFANVYRRIINAKPKTIYPRNTMFFKS